VTFEDRRRRALAILEERGVTGWTAAPPPYRMLWRLGACVPPPHFASLPVNAALLTVMVLPILLVLATMRAGPWSAALWDMAWGAILGGCCSAAAYRKEAEKYRLPSWLDLEHDEPRSSGSVLGLPRR
jgi:hypothetical protein